MEGEKCGIIIIIIIIKQGYVDIVGRFDGSS